MAEPLWMNLINMDVSLNQKPDGNNMMTMAGTRTVTKGCNMEGMDGLGVGGRGPPSSSLLASLSSSSLSSMLLSSAPANRETASSFVVQRRKVMKEDLERKETERKEMEKREMERKETEGKELEKKEGREDMDALVWIKEMERKEMEKREMERKEMERKELDKKVEREEMDALIWIKEMERKEMERMEMERKETERKGMDRKEMERKETERKGMDKKEMGRKDILILRKNTPSSSVAGRVRDMFAALGAGRKEKMTKGSNDDGKKGGNYGKGRMNRMGVEKEKVIWGRETLEVLDKEGKRKEGSNWEGRMKRIGEEEGKKIGKKEILEVLDREGKRQVGSSVGSQRRRKGMKLEVLRRCNFELVAQLHEVMEENARLREQMRRKTSGMSSSPRMRELVKETSMDVGDSVDLPMRVEFPPPLPPWDGGMQDGSKRKVGPHIARDVRVTPPTKETRNERMVTTAVSGSEAGWRVVARRNRRRDGVGDDVSPPLIPRPLRKRELIVVGLDKSVATSEIMEALCDIGGCPEEDVRMGPIRTRNNGFGTVWVQLPVAAALKVAKKGYVCVGWITARVKLLEARPLQCFRCWSFGHAQNACRSEANRWGACYRCGQKGHMSRDCVNLVHCAVCSDAGMETHHRLGGSLCAAWKRQGNWTEGRIGRWKEG